MTRAILTFDTFITVSDGTRLSARIWLPTDADQDPVPSILEYIPYRKNDWTAGRDATRHPWYASQGYAAVRVDTRGSGDSEGLLLDEYLQSELQDGCEIIAWLAEQPWCTGSVAMIGKSWGGFNALQIAALQPPALKAIVTVCSTDDRYADDVHFMGGCLMGSDMLPWASTMLAFNTRPPDPRTHGEDWRALWLERLHGSPPYIETWLQHQRRDAYWEHGSVCEDYSNITCAVYAIGGWGDPYRNAILRLLAGLDCPKRGLIGPWSHNYPDDGRPGPAIGFLQETRRFFDFWLKGTENGAMNGPLLRAWLQEPVLPKTTYAERPGRWVGEMAWPSPRITDHPIDFGHQERQILGDQAHGIEAGTFVAWGEPADLPPDQRGEDGRSLVYDSDPVVNRLEILGFPEVELELTVDQPSALVYVRLCDIAPDGSSLHITRGVLNLTHRDSHANPRPCVPGERMNVRVRLACAGHAFTPGRQIRLSVSPTSWPTVWPSPAPVTMTVHSVRLLLPERPPSPTDQQIEPFEDPLTIAPLQVTRIDGFPSTRTIERDLASGLTRVTYHADWGSHRILHDAELECEDWNTDCFEIVDGDPLSARVKCTWEIAVRRGDWSVRTRTHSELWCDDESFHVVNSVKAFEGDTLVFESDRSLSVPRDLV